MRYSEPEPHWIDTPEGKWTVLSFVMIVVSVVWIPTFYLHFNHITSHANPIIVYALYGYYPAVSIVCLLQLARVKRSTDPE